MLNYIKAELYRVFNRLYFWVFTGSIAALALLLNIVLKINHVKGMGLTTLIENTATAVGVPVFLVIVLVDMITSEEQKNLTLRNVVSFGMSRSKMIISKIISCVILMFIAAFIILTVCYGSGTILFGLGSTFPGAIKISLLKLLIAVPLWIAAISLGTLLAVVFSNNTAFAFIYAGVFVVVKGIIKLLAILVSSNFMKVHALLITTQLDKVGSGAATNQDFVTAIVSGIIYTAIFVVLTLVYFERKEVK
jgi:ABC-2 type transport system permease protein